jgi:hypothetical protein
MSAKKNMRQFEMNEPKVSKWESPNIKSHRVSLADSDEECNITTCK